MKFYLNMWQKNLLVVGLILAGVFCFVSCEGSLLNSYKAKEEAVEILNGTEQTSYSLEKSKKNYYLRPESYTAGVIFYPGGKVECEAYLPLAEAICKQGILVCIVHMPQDLAFFDVDAAESIIKQNPEVEKWYLAGHSLGGAMAGYLAADKPELFEGVIFLAAYTTKKIDDSVKCLSVYGSMDGVLSREKYEKNRINLPAGYVEKIIEGGCHAYFGDYGFQKGDGNPSISMNEQISITADLIKEFIQ